MLLSHRASERVHVPLYKFSPYAALTIAVIKATDSGTLMLLCIHQHDAAMHKSRAMAQGKPRVADPKFSSTRGEL